MSNVRKIYFSLFSKMGIALLIFSLCRIFFYLLNHNYFSDVTILAFLGGIRFDWMTVTIIYSPFLIAHLFFIKGNELVLRMLFHLSNLLAIAFNCLDLEYFKFTPSIRGVFALTDELVPDEDPNSPWTGNIDSMKTRGIFINFTFE